MNYFTSVNRISEKDIDRQCIVDKTTEKQKKKFNSQYRLKTSKLQDSLTSKAGETEFVI